jgi:hypothetical protein
MTPAAPSLAHLEGTAGPGCANDHEVSLEY